MGETVANIEKSARKESERELQKYIKSVGGNVKSKGNGTSINAKDIERRQLELLSTIYSTRDQLKQLAASKGVSLEELELLTSEMKLDENEVAIDVDELNKGFDALFENLTDMALTVQQTAKQYGVKLDKKE